MGDKDRIREQAGGHDKTQMRDEGGGSGGGCRNGQTMDIILKKNQMVFTKYWKLL